MAITSIRGKQIVDGSVQRADLDTTTVGQAVTAKLIQGTGITLSSTGADAGTGDVTITASGSGPSASTPAVLGETAADAFFTGGIIVPRYKNHPDGIWTYGAFDDHFDNPSSGTPNAKWVNTQTSGILTPVFTQAASKLCLGGTSPAASATVYANTVTQTLPIQATHTISFQVNFLGFPLYTAGNDTYVFCVFQLEYAAGSGIQLIFQRYFYYAGGALSEGMNLNYGASFGTAGPLFRTSNQPVYLQFVYDATKKTTINFSSDGITWSALISLTGAQSGFSTTSPSQWTMGIRSFWASPAFAQFDWIKHV